MSQGWLKFVVFYHVVVFYMWQFKFLFIWTSCNISLPNCVMWIVCTPSVPYYLSSGGMHNEQCDDQKTLGTPME
jgi:hypothetical protein